MTLGRPYNGTKNRHGPRVCNTDSFSGLGTELKTIIVRNCRLFAVRFTITEASGNPLPDCPSMVPNIHRGLQVALCRPTMEACAARLNCICLL